MRAIIAWRRLSTRTELLKKAIPDTELWFFKTNASYFNGIFKTILKIILKKPSTLILQLPQGPLLLIGVLLKKTLNCKLVVDVHTGFVYSFRFKGFILNKPFNILLNYVDLIIVHNQEILEILSPKIVAKTIVVYDPWMFIQLKKEQLSNGDYLVFPASFAPDEPLAEVLSAVNEYKKLKVFVTGNYNRKPSLLRFSSSYVEFTGFLNRKDFEKILLNSLGIISGTKDEYTLMMSAWEAVAFNKALILSETKTLRNMFNEYAFFYNYRDQNSIILALSEIINKKDLTSARKKLRKKTNRSLTELVKKLNQM